MDDIVAILRGSYRRLKFRSSDKFYWSPETHEVFFDKRSNQSDGIWSLLHETGHALLNHISYQTDFELIQLEVDAWERAKSLAGDLSIEIDENHIQDCIDTYRDWLYSRSICPSCSNKSLQQSDLIHYRCFNCHTVWRVTPSRFCRAYRSTKHTPDPAVVFQLTGGSWPDD